MRAIPDARDGQPGVEPLERLGVERNAALLTALAVDL
jgi:hypothetical protein